MINLGNEFPVGLVDMFSELNCSLRLFLPNPLSPLSCHKYQICTAALPTASPSLFILYRHSVFNKSLIPLIPFFFSLSFHLDIYVLEDMNMREVSS